MGKTVPEVWDNARGRKQSIAEMTPTIDVSLMKPFLSKTVEKAEISNILQ